MELTKKQLLKIIREEAAKSTKKYDDAKELTGDQDELPDALQKGIIDKKKNETDEMQETDETDEMQESMIRISRKDFIKMLREEMSIAAKEPVELDAGALASLVSDIVGDLDGEPQIMGAGGTAKMAKQQLQQIASTAQSLHDRLGDDDELPEWTQSKIAVAEDNIGAVSDHLGYKMDNQE